jgi:hypothetical protein
MGFIGRLFRLWWARPAAFLPFREAAARLYEETRAADMVLPHVDIVPCPVARFDYHARQLVHHAKYGKATLYGKRTPTTGLEPIARHELWTGQYDNDMNSWFAENGTEYVELSLRHHDLRRIVRWVKQAVKDHDALLAWCHRHASSNTN